jgi:hypothetical protein
VRIGRRQAAAGSGAHPGLAYTRLERIAIVLCGFAIAVGAIAALSGFFAAQDQAGVGADGAGPGQEFADQGNIPLSSVTTRPAYNSDPPTSGAHIPATVDRNLAPLSVDQLLEALALGDVVITYGGPAPPPGLTALAGSVAAPFSPALAAAGQAAILAPRPGTNGIVAAAWAHLIRVRSPSDPQLRHFIEYWLGRGAPTIVSPSAGQQVH